MRKLTVIVALACASVLAIACAKTDASTAVSGPQPTHATPDPNFSPAPIYTAPEPAAVQDDAPRISLADAKKDFDEGTAIFFDVRTEENYKEEHAKGAINVTFDNMKEKTKNIPKDKKIIAYCSCPNEHSAAVMVTELRKKGFKNTFALLGGTLAWKNAGYPMESGK